MLNVIMLSVTIKSIKARLHYGENLAKLAHFKEQKETLCVHKTL